MAIENDGDINNDRIFSPGPDKPRSNRKGIPWLAKTGIGSEKIARLQSFEIAGHSETQSSEVRFVPDKGRSPGHSRLQIVCVGDGVGQVIGEVRKKRHAQVCHHGWCTVLIARIDQVVAGRIKSKWSEKARCGKGFVSIKADEHAQSAVSRHHRGRIDRSSREILAGLIRKNVFVIPVPGWKLQTGAQRYVVKWVFLSVEEPCLAVDSQIANALGIGRHSDSLSCTRGRVEHRELIKDNRQTDEDGSPLIKSIATGDIENRKPLVGSPEIGETAIVSGIEVRARGNRLPPAHRYLRLASSSAKPGHHPSCRRSPLRENSRPRRYEEGQQSCYSNGELAFHALSLANSGIISFQFLAVYWLRCTRPQ